MKAHDVRHLCVCSRCHQLADDRETVNRDFPTWGASKWEWKYTSWHPQCYYVQFGAQNVQCLPRSERDKFRLCDIPTHLMKVLLQLREDAPAPKTAVDRSE